MNCKCDWTRIIREKKFIKKIICNKCGFYQEDKYFYADKDDEKGNYIECPTCKNRIYKEQITLTCDKCNKKKIMNCYLMASPSLTRRR